MVIMMISGCDFSYLQNGALLLLRLGGPHFNVIHIASAWDQLPSTVLQLSG